MTGGGYAEWVSGASFDQFDLRTDDKLSMLSGKLTDGTGVLNFD